MAQSCPTITAPLQTVYNEIIEGTPIVVTPTVLQMRLVGEGHPFQYVLSYMIRIRSMGTATYIAIGDEYGQEQRLYAAGQTLTYSCNRYEVIDLTRKYVRADVADAVLEVSFTFLPMKMYGRVNRAY
jgi:dTDP-glucose pyrophosphorylase